MALSKQSSLLWIHAVGIGACLLISLLAYRILVGPILERRAAAADLSRAKQTRQEETAQLEAAIVAAQERLDAARQRLAAGAVQLESADHVNQRIAALTALFSDCRLHVDDVRTGGVSGGRQYDLVPITLVGRGAYRQCLRLLHGLHARYPDMSVVRIELSANPAEQPDGGRFRLELFWYAAPNAAAAQGGLTPQATGSDATVTSSRRV